MPLPRGLAVPRTSPGRCKHRPLQGFVVMRGRSFPVGRGIFPVPQGGRSRPPHIGGLKWRRLRRRGVRRDEGIPPYGRPEGSGRPCLARNTKFIRRGGIYPTRGTLRRRGVRRDEGIPPYGRPVGCGCPVSRVMFGRFVGAGFTAPQKQNTTSVPPCRISIAAARPRTASKL